MLDKKKKNTFLAFQIAKEAFAVSVEKVLEVLERQYITEVPNVHAYIKGVINFRGKIIPVIDSRLKFNLSERQNEEKYVVIVFDLFIENKKMLIGAMVDNVHDVLSIEESAVLNVPELGYNYNTEFILGMLKNGEGFTMILDVDKMFSREEINLIDKVKQTKEVGELESTNETVADKSKK